jgi:hypothetical protein
MPRNPNKTHCSIAGCQAWAKRDSDPPLCAAHAGLGGAPPGNQNRLVHGFYASSLRPDEAADAAGFAGNATLDDEIVITRIALRRVLQMLLTGQTPGPNPQPLNAQDYARFSGLAFQGVSTLSRLLQVHHALGGGVEALMNTAIGRALDELGDEWGIEL